MKPTLDMSDVLVAPEFQDEITVKRRKQVTGENGRVQPETEVFTHVGAVVCSASANDLERLDDNQRMGRNLSVISKFRLQGPSPGLMPDIVVWQGDSYVVKLVDPYQRYGSGFIQTIVGSIDSQDRGTGNLAGMEDFSNPSNSNLTGQG